MWLVPFLAWEVQFRVDAPPHEASRAFLRADAADPSVEVDLTDTGFRLHRIKAVTSSERLREAIAPSPRLMLPWVLEGRFDEDGGGTRVTARYHASTVAKVIWVLGATVDLAILVFGTALLWEARRAAGEEQATLRIVGGFFLALAAGLAYLFCVPWNWEKFLVAERDGLVRYLRDRLERVGPEASADERRWRT